MTPTPEKPRRGGRGRGRGGGRGSRGASAAATGGATAPESLRGAKPKGDKPKPGRKGGGSNSSSGTRSSPPSATSQAGRPPRATPLLTRKVLVRNIPIEWSEEKLLNLVVEYGAPRDNVWRLVLGKVRSNNRPPRLTRLYLDFKKERAAAKAFIERLNGFSEGDAMLDVGFAPFQKIPREKQRKDGKVGTIDRDADYLAFVEALSKPKEKLPSADVITDLKENDNDEKPVAALVQFLNERKRDKKGKFGKSADKSRGGRSKLGKEGRSSKDKTKGSKGKTKTIDNSTSKEGTKGRKTRGKHSTTMKEKNTSPDPVQPGHVKIMSTNQGLTPNDGNNVTDTPRGRSSGDGANLPKPRTKVAGNKSNRAPSQQIPMESSGNEPHEVPPKEGRGSSRARRDRFGKGQKSSGRGDAPKKVFAPKTTSSSSTA